MNTITDRYYVPSARTCILMKSVGGVCLFLVAVLMFYGMYLVHTQQPEQAHLLLAPEQTVLFYQPDIALDLAPLADVPQELEYINHPRHLA